MFKNFLGKDKEDLNAEQIPTSEQQFMYTMEIAHSWLEKCEWPESTMILDYMMNVIREDFKSSVMITIFYRKEHFKDYDRMIFFPENYFNENGEELKIHNSANEETININLKDTCVITVPWSRDRMKRAIEELNVQDFIFHSTNHYSTYYTPIEVCYIESGGHSIAAGIGYKKGEIISKKVDVSKAFPHLFSDGAYWYNTHTKKRLNPVYDFRVALLFELAKLKDKQLNDLLELNME